MIEGCPTGWSGFEGMLELIGDRWRLCAQGRRR
jgi:hypothetical protein